MSTITSPAGTAASIIDAAGTLFQPFFKNSATWAAWFTALRVLFGLPLAAGELELFQKCTGRATPPPAAGFSESWLICGRRAGKSRILALIAAYLATCLDWSPYLSPGERGTVMVLAADRRQARTIFGYARALLKETPELAGLVERETAESLDLANGVTIEILTSSFRATRGYTVVAALCDEIAFWRDEDSSNPDVEILAALRPAMATIPGARLLCASSPYARRGAMWEAYRQHFGKDDAPVLVWKAPTEMMNPLVDAAVIKSAYERDPASAAAEYGAEFRTDVEAFLPREVIDAAIERDRRELSPVAGCRYVGFVDPSGGAADSFTLGIAHAAADGGVVLDCVRERLPPFSPDDVVAEYAGLLSSYGLRQVTGDRYAGEWPIERFRMHGIDYRTSTRSKSQIYLELLPLMNAGRVELLDHGRLAGQLAGLERRTARGGRDSVDHGPGGHDDVANAAAGAIVEAGPQGVLAPGAGVAGFYKMLAEEARAQQRGGTAAQRRMADATLYGEDSPEFRRRWGFEKEEAAGERRPPDHPFAEAKGDHPEDPLPW